jgi:hypothetical protein
MVSQEPKGAALDAGTKNISYNLPSLIHPHPTLTLLIVGFLRTGTSP